MAYYETKVVLVASGGMNRKIRKLNHQGWRVISTAGAGMPGYMHVTLERSAPPPLDRKAQIAEAKARLAQSKAELAAVGEQGKSQREAAAQARPLEIAKIKARAGARKAERKTEISEKKQLRQKRKAIREAEKRIRKDTFPPAPWT
jgi:hypothetical protein